MNNFKARAQGFRCYKQHKVVDDTNDSELFATKERVPVAMESPASLVKDFLFNQTMLERNDLRALDVMNNLGL